MGTNWSSLDREPSPDLWWPQNQRQPETTQQDEGEEEAVKVSMKGERGKVREEELEAFKQELARKRALRHEALAALQLEMRDLRKRVEQEKELRLKAEEERDKLKMLSHEELQRELENEREEKRKMLEERERLMEEVEEKAGLERQVQALKDVSQIGKEMLRIRELQVKELKKKLVEINISSVMAPPEDLRVEYEKQIENIRKLRTLYEERAAATLIKHRQELEREEARITVLETKLSDLQKETEEYKEAKKVLEGKIEQLESSIQYKEDELERTKDDLFSTTVQNKSLNSQMALINNLFSQMLVSPKVDLDRLTRLLKENHGLIKDLTEKGDSNEVAALLVDLAGQVEKEQEANQEQENTSESIDENCETQSEIASNLTKVWRVMIELLSHHQNSSHIEFAGGAESCYKCIETPTGPRSVISVSQTFLTLKDLILEKNRLVQEVGRLKTLNNHLEHRLGSQEKRLSVVTTELRKTWGVVNKLKAQHKQLHTHEKILRYELQQKRCMLTELKEELEHCRDKWERARQKNSQTEEDWKKLRKEFAARKSRKESNSAESGYEEEDVAQSPPSEPGLFELRPNEESEPELSEEDIEHSDGNSFDTVIDLLDIACLENQTEGDSDIPFVLCEVSPQTSEISPSLLPLTGSEFTEGLDQIESEDLAAVLDIQYQNPLLGADYNLSLPSSSGSSPIPTENDDFASSEMDISEEDLSFNENHIHSSPLPVTTQSVPEEMLLFGSNSSKNISMFLDGLFVDQQHDSNLVNPTRNLFLNVPSTSQETDDDTPTPLVKNENHYQFPEDSATPLISNENCYEFPINNRVALPQSKTEDPLRGVELNHVDDHHSSNVNAPILTEVCEGSMADQSVESHSLSESEAKTTEEVLQSREDRLKRLEQQCRSIVSKVTSTSFRSEVVSNKLDEPQLCYGSLEEVSGFEEGSLSHLKGEETKACQQTEMNKSVSNLLNDGGLDLSNCNMACETSSTQETIKSCPSRSDQIPQSSSPVKRKTPEEILEARAARLKRLEDQCKSLFSKMSATSSRSDLISNKLDELHDSFGSSEQTNKTDQPATFKVCSPNTKSLSPEKSETKCQESDTGPISIIKEEKRNSKPPDLASESKRILNECSVPGPSVQPIPDSLVEPKKHRTTEEILDARAERFKRLEEQCKSLVSKMTATSLRSEIISNKLDELHSCYGSSEDASDSDEHSSSSREGDKKVTTPTSSPKSNRKIACSAEKNKQKEIKNDQDFELDSEEKSVERVSMPQTTNSYPEHITQPNLNASNIDRSKLTPEEILQARAQRLNRLEEQCKSLFSKMSATSQRSDVISNRLEELHEHYGQPSTSDSLTPSSFSDNTDISLVEQDNDEGSSHSQTSSSTNSIEEQSPPNVNDGETSQPNQTGDIRDCKMHK